MLFASKSFDVQHVVNVQFFYHRQYLLGLTFFFSLWFSQSNTKDLVNVSTVKHKVHRYILCAQLISSFQVQIVKPGSSMSLLLCHSHYY